MLPLPKAESPSLMNDVFITSTGAFLPGPPIDNEQVEDVLGLVNGKKSKLKRRILKSNGIQKQHYAIDAEQKAQFQNEDMAVAAARQCLERSFIDPSDVGMLGGHHPRRYGAARLWFSGTSRP